jgi:hypothetical protein
MVFSAIVSRDKAGKYLSIVKFTSTNNTITMMRGCEIEWVAPFWQQCLPTALATLTGMTIAICAFFLKEVYSYFNRRKQLKARFGLIFQELRDYANGKAVDWRAPEWVMSPATSEWCEYLVQRPFLGWCSKLREVEIMKLGGSISNEEILVLVDGMR